MLANLRGNEIFEVVGTVGLTGFPSGTSETTTVESVAAASTNLFNLRTITEPGDVQVEDDDYDIIIRKDVDEVTTVYAYDNPIAKQRFRVKDGNGHSGTYNITVDGNGYLIDGAPQIVLNNGYEAVEFMFDGAGYNLMAAYSATAIPPGTNYLTDESGNILTDESGQRIVTSS